MNKNIEPTGPVKWYAETSGKVIDYIFSKYPHAPRGRNYYGEDFGHLMTVSIPDHSYLRKMGYLFLEEDQFVELIYNPFKLRMAAKARESSESPSATRCLFDVMFDSMKLSVGEINSQRQAVSKENQSLMLQLKMVRMERDYYKKQLEDMFN